MQKGRNTKKIITLIGSNGPHGEEGNAEKDILQTKIHKWRLLKIPIFDCVLSLSCQKKFFMKKLLEANDIFVQTQAFRNFIKFYVSKRKCLR